MKYEPFELLRRCFGCFYFLSLDLRANLRKKKIKKKMVAEEGREGGK